MANRGRPSIPKTPIKCYKCNLEYANKTDFSYHLNYCYDNPNKRGSMEFWEALIELQDLTDISPIKHRCKVCGLTTNHQWAMDRHLDNKHSDILYYLSNQAHGWDNAKIGWK